MTEDFDSGVAGRRMWQGLGNYANGSNCVPMYIDVKCRTLNCVTNELTKPQGNQPSRECYGSNYQLEYNAFDGKRNTHANVSLNFLASSEPDGPVSENTENAKSSCVGFIALTNPTYIVGVNMLIVHWRMRYFRIHLEQHSAQCSSYVRSP